MVDKGFWAGRDCGSDGAPSGVVAEVDKEGVLLVVVAIVCVCRVVVDGCDGQRWSCLSRTRAVMVV